MITTDTQAWQQYPFHRNWFNKLWVSEKLKYNCGPNATPVPVNGNYVIRPIYNLHGMGAGARILYLDTADIDTVPPGYFWCEAFEGEHLSAELFWHNNHWSIACVYKGTLENNKELFRFKKWQRVTNSFAIPSELNELWDCGFINIELIGNKIIEVHLRGSPDPIQYSEFIPVWSDTPSTVIMELDKTHSFVKSFDYVYGTNISRVGFYCK